MPDVPRSRTLDDTLGLLSDGYEFIGKRCRRFHSDAFEGRLLGQRVLFVTGREAAELFYDERHFRRADAVPAPIKRTLFGAGGVQTLDDEAHRARKALFMSVMTRQSIARFLVGAELEWRAALSRWQHAGRVVLLEEAQRVLFRAACRWVGVPLDVVDDQRAADMASMVDGFAAPGRRFVRALLARARSERWATSLVIGVRRGEVAVPGDAPLALIADHRERGERLPAHAASVELLNLVRPTTAIAWYVAFLAVALRDHPVYHQRLLGDDTLLEPFVHELRRYYPFAPLLGARARHSFQWRGVSIRRNQLVLLDLYGTLRDPRVFQDADEFRPERFLARTPSAFELIPQGGGDYFTGHRCAGEWLTIGALAQATRFFVRDLRYDLVAQDLSYRLSRVPSRPKSGVVLTRVSPRVTTATPATVGVTNGKDGPPSSRVPALHGRQMGDA